MATHLYARRPRTYGEMLSWSYALRGEGVLQPGAIDLLHASGLGVPVSSAALTEIFEPSALQSLFSASKGDPLTLLGWWRAHMTPEFTRRTQFAVDVLARRGAESLLGKPGVIVGTIHSVKGGQADVVYLFPDLSKAGDD